MANQYERYVLLFVFSCFTYSAYGYQFIVGGRDGWVLNPSQNYNQWAERMRFQVNDTLLFKYKSGSDSVLVVNKDDYDKCNTGNPILKLDDGNSVFKFDRSGPFYFISGNKANCDQGQKLITVVLAVRNSPKAPLPNAPSPGAAAPPQGSSPSPFPAAVPPQGSSPSPSPAAVPPQGSSPSPSPAAAPPQGSSPSPSPGGAAPTPASSPSSSPSPATEAPTPASQGSGPSPAATSPGTSSSPPSSTTPGSPGSSTPGSGAPTPGNTPADVNSTGGPPARALAAPACTPSVVLVSTVSLVLSVGLGGFIISP